MKSRYFQVHELVPKHIFNTYGEKAWKFIDSRLVETIDTLKEQFPNGTITINNYYWGGNRQWSGLRTPDSPDYSETSQHSLGNAIDAVFSEYDIESVRSFIVSNLDLFPHIKGMELAVSWLHIDTRNETTLVTFNK